MPRKPKKIQIIKEVDEFSKYDFEKDLTRLIPLLQSIQDDAIAKGFDSVAITEESSYDYGDECPTPRFIFYAYREETDQERDARVKKDRDLKKQREKEIEQEELKQLEKLSKKYGKS